MFPTNFWKLECLFWLLHSAKYSTFPVQRPIPNLHKCSFDAWNEYLKLSWTDLLLCICSWFFAWANNFTDFRIFFIVGWAQWECCIYHTRTWDEIVAASNWKKLHNGASVGSTQWHHQCKWSQGKISSVDWLSENACMIFQMSQKEVYSFDGL